jgi:protein O-mannosyl-transferase
MQGILSDNKKLYFLFLALCLLFYGNSIKNGFSFDDAYVTIVTTPVKGQKYTPNNPLVAGGIKNIPTIWRSHYGHGEGTSYDYRPVTTTLFAIEYDLFGPSPHLNHFVSIILYSLIVFVFYLVLKICLRDYPFGQLFAFVCAVVFLAHPIHTEVVDNIKCTDELLAMLFGLLAVFHSIHFFEAKKIKHIVWLVVFIFLAFYSKLTSAVFIAIIPLFLFFFLKIPKKQLVFIFIGLLVCYIVYTNSKNLLVSEKEVRYFYHFENPLFTEQISFFAKVLFALKSFGIYIKLFFFPYPLRFYYGTDMVPTNLSFGDFEIILAFVFIAASIWFCFKTKNKLAIFGLLFFLLCMAPIINFTEPVAGIIGERLCFIASAGFVIFIVAVLFLFYKSIPAKINFQFFGKKPMVYISFILLVFLFYTWNRNSQWKDEITLFEHDAPFLERSAGANNLLANKYFDMLYKGSNKYNQKELVEKCKHHYTLAFTEDSTVYSSFNNLGVIYFTFLSDFPTALNYFIRASHMHKDYPQANENIANCYDRLGEPFKAIKYYRIALAQNYKQLKSYLQIARILLRQKRFKEAGRFLEITDKIFPNDYSLTIESGNYYYLTGEYELAADKFGKAFLSKKKKELAYSLYLTYLQLHDNEKAAYFKKEFESFPQ